MKLECKYIYEDWRNFDFENFLVKSFDKIILLGWSDHPRSSNKEIFQSLIQMLQRIKIIDKIFNYSKAEIYFYLVLALCPN